MPKKLKVSDRHRLSCPECGGELRASVEVWFTNCIPTVVFNETGAYFDGHVDIDTDENDGSESNITRLYCQDCDWDWRPGDDDEGEPEVQFSAEYYSEDGEAE